jgi:hypothetical protein
MMDVKQEVNVIAEESIEYSKHLRFGSPTKIFTLANKVSEYAKHKLTSDPQSMRETRNLLWELGHVVSDSDPIDIKDIEVKVDIINKITDVGHTLEARMGAVRRMKAATKSRNYGEAMIERAKQRIMR